MQQGENEIHLLLQQMKVLINLYNGPKKKIYQ